MNKAQKYAAAIRKQQDTDPVSKLMIAIYHEFAVGQCLELKRYMENNTGIKDSEYFLVNKNDRSVLFLRMEWHIHVINGVDYYVGQEIVKFNSAREVYPCTK